MSKFGWGVGCWVWLLSPLCRQILVRVKGDQIYYSVFAPTQYEAEPNGVKIPNGFWKNVRNVIILNLKIIGEIIIDYWMNKQNDTKTENKFRQTTLSIFDPKIQGDSGCPESCPKVVYSGVNGKHRRKCVSCHNRCVHWRAHKYERNYQRGVKFYSSTVVGGLVAGSL